MQSEIATWQTHDGIDIHCKIWNRSDAEKEVWFVHGLGDHGGRYIDLAERLFDEGFRVIIADQRGNGLSGGKRGHASGFDVLIDDLKLTMENTGTQGTEKYLMGQSMGGLVVARFIQRFASLVDGAVLLSPMFRTTNPPPKFKLLIAKLLKSIWPSLTMKAGLRLDDLATSEEKKSEYRADKLKHQLISTAFAVTFLEAAEHALTEAETITTPILAMHGSADQITSHLATIEFADRSKSTDLKIWDDRLHELINDSNSEEIVETMMNWLRHH